MTIYTVQFKNGTVAEIEGTPMPAGNGAAIEFYDEIMNLVAIVNLAETLGITRNRPATPESEQLRNARNQELERKLDAMPDDDRAELEDLRMDRAERLS